MSPPFPELPWIVIVSLAVLAITAIAALFGFFLRYQPRRPVPWHTIDLVLVVVFYFVAQSGAVGLAHAVLGPHVPRAAVAHSPGQSTAEHVIGQLIAEGNAWVLLLCVVSATIVAPVTEEFFFRVLLQGWLEALQHRWRRQMPTLRRLVPNGVGPVVLVSLLFAGMHFRVESPPVDARFLVFLLAGDAVARLLAVAFAVGLLRWRVGATAADLGWAPQKTLGDIALGLTAFAAVAAPIYAMQLALRSLLPEYIAPDPLPLFFLALALGTLYYRTHRLMPLIVLHAALNGTSLVLAWLCR